MGRLAAALMLPLCSGGCTSVALATIDQRMSQATELDCSTARLMLGEPYCRSRTVPVEQQPLYCYRSLGTVDCYAVADPYDINVSGRARQPLPLHIPAPEPAAAAATSGGQG